MGWGRLLASALVVMLFVILAVGTSSPDDEAASTEPAAEAAEAVPAAPQYPRLDALQATIARVMAGGIGPAGEELADAFGYDDLRYDSAGPGPNPPRTAAQLVAGDPGHLVIIRHELSPSWDERARYLAEVLDARVAPGLPVTLGLRGPNGFGAIATRPANGEWSYQLGSDVSLATLDAALTPHEVPAGVVREFHVGEITSDNEALDVATVGLDRGFEGWTMEGERLADRYGFEVVPNATVTVTLSTRHLAAYYLLLLDPQGRLVAANHDLHNDFDGEHHRVLSYTATTGGRYEAIVLGGAERPSPRRGGLEHIHGVRIAVDPPR